MTRHPGALAVLVVAACVAAAVALVRENTRNDATGRGPDSAGKRIERCLSCHVRPDESPGGAHSSDAVGCEACHLGNPFAFDKERAHAGLEREPGALDTVGRTCGREGCHVREAERVATSLMATGRGLIAVDRWVLGETPGPDGVEDFAELLATTTPTPAQDHLRRLCAGCHLRTRGTNRDDAVRGIGSGCGACHATRKDPLTLRAHPPVDAKVPDDRCLGCHSRSGRISLSYAGLAELKPGQQSPDETVRLFDGRPAARVLDDIHHEKGVGCTDCHLHGDVMGDGTAYAHQEQQVAATCEACHGPVGDGDQRPWAAVRDPVSSDLLRMRDSPRAPLEPARLGRRGFPIWNARPTADLPVEARPQAGADGRTAPWTMLGKNDGRPHALRQTPADTDHRLAGHRRLSCQACHSAWAPSCVTCHTRFDPGGRQWDFGTGAVAAGEWVEESERYGWGAPALAIQGDRVVPAIPGMVLTADLRNAGGTNVSRRLYAAIDPHTTRKESRSCASCHASSTALGLGAGTLDLGDDGPRFTPAWPQPGAPDAARDGWVSLFPQSAAPGTRTDVRSLDAPEQRRVLRVGPCLPCHEKSADPVYRDFERSVRSLVTGGSACAFIPPPWIAR
jgi:hypothetical protein